MTTFGDMVYSCGGIPNVGDLLMGVNHVFFVDGNLGSDGNDGDSWDAPFATIATAIAASNDTIDWSAYQARFNAILVAPGVYAESLTDSPYMCKVIGLGVRGTDTETEWHPTTGSCLADTLLGTCFYNIHFEVNEAVDCINGGIVNSSEIAYCTFASGAAVTANGITTENSTHLHVHHCSFESGWQTLGYGIYFGGGSNKYAHNVRIHDNVIFAATAGIYIHDNCTASQAVIGPNNVIARPTTGIYDGNGTSLIVGNYISASTDAISHANTLSMCIGNYVINNVTAAFESAHAT